MSNGMASFVLSNYGLAGFDQALDFGFCFFVVHLVCLSG
jgi:hypothetical protein